MAITRHHSLTASSFVHKGVDAASKGSLTEAERCFRQAFLLAKKEGGAFNLGAANLIRLLHQQKRSQDVVDVVEELGREQTLRLPQICILMAAESAFTACKHDASALLYESLNAAFPREKAIALGYSQNLLTLGQLRKSRNILNNYIKLQGADAEVISNLAIIALESGYTKEAEEHYRAALRLAPSQFITHYNLGTFLQSHGSLSEAITEFDACLKIVPNAIEAITAKAEALKKIGRQNEANELYKSRLQNSGLNDQQSIALAKPLIAAALEEGDIESCKQYLATLSTKARSDFHIRSILHDLPSSLQDDYGGGAHLYDPTRLVVAKTFIAEASTLKHIANYILSNESLINDRPGKPTRGGSQTHEIMESQDHLINQLKEKLKAELMAYVKQLPTSIKPASNATYRISGWGVSLESGGRQLRHTHPEAIASGVLYLAIPKDMTLNDDKQGALYFSNWKEETDRSTLHIEATAGKLVMFPSYMPHETVPFEAKQKRICLAINLIEIPSK